MPTNLDSLGEQTISKIAEVALASQMKHVDDLSVKVKIDGERLSKGIVNALVMKGKGLITQSSLRVDEISLIIEEIGVYPFKALMGNIQLTKPAQGNATMSVKTNDLTQAIEHLFSQQNPTGVQLNGLDCELSAPNSMHFKMKISGQDSSSNILEMSLKTIFKPQYQGVIIEDVEYIQGENFAETIGEQIQKNLLDILNFRFTVFDGLSFSVKSLEIVEDKLKLMAIAKITSFPKSV